MCNQIMVHLCRISPAQMQTCPLDCTVCWPPSPLSSLPDEIHIFKGRHVPQSEATSASKKKGGTFSSWRNHLHQCWLRCSWASVQTITESSRHLHLWSLTFLVQGFVERCWFITGAGSPDCSKLSSRNYGGFSSLRNHQCGTTLCSLNDL